MDLTRVVAMVLVVLDHAVIEVAPLAERATSDVRWWVAEALLAVSRLAVPLFIMVSGALLLDPARTEPVSEFARRRLQRVAVPLLVWALTYLTFRKDVLAEPLTGERAVDDLASGSPYYHLYYLYIALGLYALTPFLRRLIGAVDRRTIMMLCGMAFALGIGDQFLRTVLQVGSSNGLTYFVDYVGFYLAGWLLRDVRLRRGQTRTAAAALVAAVAVVVLASATLVELGAGEHWFYPATYLSPAVIAAAVALLLLLQTARLGTSSQSVVRRLSDLSLGTYLVHPMLLDLFRRATVFRREAPSMPGGVDGLLGWVLGLTVGGLLAGMAVTFVARLVPVVRRVF
jgi:surface polysaccharide O-acyltransferase-like enzyme